MNIRYPIYEGVYRILTLIIVFVFKGLLLSEKCQVGARRTLLRRSVKLGARSAESCTRIFVILCRGAASSF